MLVSLPVRSSTVYFIFIYIKLIEVTKNPTLYIRKDCSFLALDCFAFETTHRVLLPTLFFFVLSRGYSLFRYVVIVGFVTQLLLFSLHSIYCLVT